MNEEKIIGGSWLLTFTSYVVESNSTMLVENPLVIGTSANDDLINSVSVDVYFTSPTYYLGRQIGSFTYTNDWSNSDVIDFINSYVNSIKK